MKLFLAMLMLAVSAFAADAPESTPPDDVNKTNSVRSDLPQELEGIAALADNEKAMVEAVRAFHKEQESLAEWDMGLAAEHFQGKDETLAKADQERAMNRFQLVAKAYEEVFRHFPNNAVANNYYGELLYDRLGDHTKAVQCWKLAASVDPKFGAPRNNLAIHYCHIGDYRQGFQYFEQAIKLEPKNPDYLFNIAQIYLVHFTEIERQFKKSKKKIYAEAMEYSKKAAAYAPDDFDILQDYAVNFFAGSNFGVAVDWKDAAKAWQTARPHARDDNERFFTWLNEGRAWIRANEPAKAEQCLTEAMAIVPDSPVVKQLLDEVRSGKTKQEEKPASEAKQSQKSKKHKKDKK